MKTALLDRLFWRLVLIGALRRRAAGGRVVLLPRAAVDGHRFSPTDGHPFPRRWPCLLPTGGRPRPELR